jgi:hypothetical protein
MTLAVFNQAGNGTDRFRVGFAIRMSVMKQGTSIFSNDLFVRVAQGAPSGFVHERDAAMTIETVDPLGSGIENNQAFGCQAFALFFSELSVHELTQLPAHARQEFGRVFVTVLRSFAKEGENAERAGANTKRNRDCGLYCAGRVFGGTLISGRFAPTIGDALGRAGLPDPAHKPLASGGRIGLGARIRL